MGRYKIVEHPTQQPGVDYVTGSGVGPFIDTGRDITFGERIIGHLYLSKASVEEMARELGITETASEEQLKHVYNKGKLDALREGLGDELVRVANALHLWSAVLSDGDSDNSDGESA